MGCRAMTTMLMLVSVVEDDDIQNGVVVKYTTMRGYLWVCGRNNIQVAV
jgi:hypothetical protein